MKKSRMEIKKVNGAGKRVCLAPNVRRTTLNIRNEYFGEINTWPQSVSKTVDDALTLLLVDRFRNRLQITIDALYDDLFGLEKLKERGKIGNTVFTEDHQFQIESYNEAIKILENSPLYWKSDT